MLAQQAMARICIRLTYLRSLFLVTSWFLIVAENRAVASSPNENEIRSAKERALGLSYHVLPFTITWRIQIDETQVVDRQPTVPEYEGVAQATTQWIGDTFQEIHVNQHHNNDNNRNIQLRNVHTVVTSATWDPDTIQIARSTSYFPHTISLDCEVHFQFDASSTVTHHDDAVPSVGSFLLDMTARSDVSDFISNHLHQTGESRSIFRYTRRASYASYERGSYQPVQPDNAAAVTNTTSALHKNVYVVTFDMIWSLALKNDNGAAVEDRMGTPDEYAGVVNETHFWLHDNMQRYYDFEEATTSSNNSHVDINDFYVHQVSTQLVGTPTWDDSQQFPHRIVVGVMIVSKATNELDVPTAAEFLRDMSTGFSVVMFITAYLRSTSGLFHHTQRASYGSSYSNPGVHLVDEDDDEEANSVWVTDEEATVGKKSVPVKVPFSLTFGLAQTSTFESDPSDDDWQGLLASTAAFLEPQLEAHFSATTSQLEEVTALWTQSVYLPWESRMPYRGTLELTFWFESNENHTLPALKVYDYQFLLSGIFGGGSEEYLSDYLATVEPPTNLFRSVDKLAWAF
ncbi:expressed unknown protein [Seminavis robusta]|uniref:Uncharacterized protein n=1 Tax=Seminavis robusta TaxID=568900 RepID=A0A9N8ED08_9STRA|nr:expressed unknown protein [Seminavis robusta]|eukprot:Sro996_g229240.1 n/a (571) ;mRNA; r:7625-9337